MGSGYISARLLTGKGREGDWTMNRTRDKISICLIGWIIVFIAPFISSCAYDKQFAYTEDQISNLNRKTTSLQEAIDEKLTSIDEKLISINANQAQMMIEVNQLKDDIRDLSGRVEDNEYLIKTAIEKDLTEQDAILEDLAKLAELERALKQQQEYLGLEPFDAKEEQQGDQEDMEAPIPDQEDMESIEEDQESEEGMIYDSALLLYREENYELALEGFKEFLNTYPKSDLADNAQFWIGECLMALEQYEQAILAYQAVITNYPKANKVPNAMLRQAIAFLEINDKTSAKLLLQKVIKQFPDTNEANVARIKIKTIE